MNFPYNELQPRQLTVEQEWARPNGRGVRLGLERRCQRGGVEGRPALFPFFVVTKW
jgi:hypothetical protein